MGEVRGFKIRVQLYTVPGQVFYEETRKRVLRGADGVVFVADSQESMWDANLASFEALNSNLTENHIPPESIPIVLQYNKRDLPNICSIEEMDAAINPGNLPFFEAMANEGVGVEDTLRSVTKLVLKNLMSKDLFGKTEAPPQMADDKKVKAQKPSLDSTVMMDRSKLLSELGISGKPTPHAKVSPPPAPSAPLDDPFGSGGADDALLGGESPLAIDEQVPLGGPAEPEEVVFEEATPEPFLLQTEETPPVPFQTIPPPAPAVREIPRTAPASGPALILTVGRECSLAVEVDGKRYLLRLALEPVE